MSLLKTLTKMAIGIAVAKGVSYATSGARKTTPKPAARPKTTPRKATRSSAPDDSGMGGIMDEIMGAGKSRSTARAPSSIDSLLRGTPTRSRKTAPSGGLEDLLGGLLGGKATTPSGTNGGGNLGDLFGAVLGGASGAARNMVPSVHRDEVEAAVLLRAMIMSAKADGTLDDAERAHLIDAVGDASPAEIQFTNAELAALVDIDSLLADVPRGMEEKVYMVSVMAITLDERSEAEYLHALATALGLSPDEVNGVHDHLKAPRIY